MITAFSLLPGGICCHLFLTGNRRFLHIKNDRRRLDDRRNYVLGWTNMEKIRVLETSIRRSLDKQNQSKTSWTRLKLPKSKTINRSNCLGLLQNATGYSRINSKFHMEKRKMLNYSTTTASLPCFGKPKLIALRTQTPFSPLTKSIVEHGVQLLISL